MESTEDIYASNLERNRYIDGISFMYFRNTGHGRNEIARAVYEQLKSVSMNVFAGTTPKSIQLATTLAEMKNKHAIVGEVRGVGLIQSIELAKDRKAKEHPLLREGQRESRYRASR